MEGAGLNGEPLKADCKGVAKLQMKCVQDHGKVSETSSSQLHPIISVTFYTLTIAGQVCCS